MESLESHNQILGKKYARHLLRRASYKYTKELIDQFALLTPNEALDILTKTSLLSMEKPYDDLPRENPDGYFTDFTGSDVDNFTNRRPKSTLVTAWWWYNSVHSQTLNYKMSHFLTTCFTIEKDAIGLPIHFFDHLRLTLFYAYGNYKTFAKKMCMDNAMLKYLGNQTNTKNSPNENYAREFLELFTIGRGPQIGNGNYTNYTESDIVEAAKLLSGIVAGLDRTTIDPETLIPTGKFKYSRHNVQDKKFSAAFGNKTIVSAKNEGEMKAEIDEFVEMVFSKEETAKHICRKLYKYFVKSNISSDIETNIITPLATEFYNNNYELLPTIRTLLQSKHFYDLDDSDSNDEIIGGIVKSPLQMVCEICSYLNCTYPDFNTKSEDFFRFFFTFFIHETYFKNSNMILFDPDSVAGHPALYQEPEFDKSWVSASTLIARYRLGESLIKKSNLITSAGTDFNRNNTYAYIDIVKLIKEGGLVSNPSDPNIICKELCDNLFGQEPNEDRIKYFKNKNLLSGVAENQDYYWTSAWNRFITDNDKSVIEPRLQNLVIDILKAPEFQLF